MQGTVQIALSIEKTSHAIMMKFYDCIKIGGGFVLCVNHKTVVYHIQHGIASIVLYEKLNYRVMLFNNRIIRHIGHDILTVGDDDVFSDFHTQINCYAHTNQRIFSDGDIPC